MNRLAIIALEVLCPHCRSRNYPEVPLDKGVKTVQTCEHCKKEFVLSTRPEVVWRACRDLSENSPYTDGTFSPDLVPTKAEGEFLSTK